MAKCMSFKEYEEMVANLEALGQRIGKLEMHYFIAGLPLPERLLKVRKEYQDQLKELEEAKPFLLFRHKPCLGN